MNPTKENAPTAIRALGRTKRELKYKRIPAFGKQFLALRQSGKSCQRQILPTVAELMAQAFGPGRDARSPEYKAGVRTILELRLNGTPTSLPYHLGTAHADAFFVGMEEGHDIARRMIGVCQP